MAVRPIIRYPDAVLRTPCEPVVAFDENLQRLADDLLETMRAAPGVGITGPHIGVLQRVVVIGLPEDTLRFFVNPRILEYSGEMQLHTEGSVSMPGVTEEVKRPARIRFAYQTLDGEPREEEANGFLATCVQHEIDQLDGIFWLQRLSRLKRDRAIRRWEKLRRE